MWTTPQDIIDDWIGDDVPVNGTTLQRWVARAERVVRREFPTLQDRLDSGAEPDLLDTIRDVVSAMVTRVLRNPQGVRQQQETAGEFTGSVTFGGEQPGELYLTTAEKEALTEPAKREGAQKAYTIPLGEVFDRYTHHPWCSLMFGAASCSCGVDIAGTPIYERG